MSSNYSANQYDNAFKSQRLQNWSGTKHFKERPAAQVGHTSFIADDRGHLLSGKVKKGSAWPDFKGTWDLPARIPSQHINPTARSEEGLKRLKSWGVYPQQSSSSLPHRGSRATDKLQDVGEQDGAAETSAAEVRASSQNRPFTRSDRAASQGNESQAHVAGSPDERAAHTAGKDRPLSQCSADEAALTPGAGRGTHSRPDTGEERPHSDMNEKTQSRPGSTVILQPGTQGHTGQY
ncbi:protein Flattop [Xenentodon cancila]